MDANTIVNYITPVLVPMLVAGIKWLTPKIPTWSLPLIAGSLGGLTGLISNIASHNTGNLWLSVALGLAGVGVREVVDQLKPADETIEK